jgi:hypothetical protein
MSQTAGPGVVISAYSCIEVTEQQLFLSGDAIDDRLKLVVKLFKTNLSLPVWSRG